MDSMDDTVDVAATPYSARLTEEGWEDMDFVEPADDWRQLPDGSFVSPDGKTRSWPTGTRADI